MFFGIRPCVAVASVCVICFLSPADLKAGKTFKDNFGDLDEQNGQPVTWNPGAFPGGTRDAASGDLVITSSGTSSTFVAPPDNMYDDLSMRTQLHISGPDGSTAGLFARSIGPDGILASIDTSGQIAITTLIGGNSSRQRQASTGLDPTDTDVHLQFDLMGDEVSLSAWADGVAAQQITWKDTAGIFPDSSGTLGIWQNPPTLGEEMATTYRFVEVVPEPSSQFLSAIALALAGALGRRRRCR